MAIKQRPDSPTNNFCTLNPLTTYNPTLSDGNLYSSIGASYKWGVGTIFIPSTGKWIFEIFFLTNTSTDSYNSCGVITLSFDQSGPSARTGFYGINDADSFGTAFIQNGTRQGSITLPANTLIQCIIDRDAGELTFTKDGTLQTGTGSTVTLPNSEVPLMAAIGDFNVNIITNFGQDPSFGGATNLPTGAGDYGTDAAGNSTGGRFAFQPPAGAKALCTANLSEMTPTVDDDVPQDYFKALKYPGDGVSNRSFTGVGFQPDFIWIKKRTAASSHVLVDSVRGGNKPLRSNSTDSEFSSSPWGAPNTFDSDGWTITNGSNNALLEVNDNNANYVAWSWKAGGAPSGPTSTTGSAKRINTSGTQDDASCSALATAATNAGASNVVTPTLMSINQAAGFSIVKYSGNGSIPHGLSSSLDLIIVKNLDLDGEGWTTWHSSFGSGDYVYLNSTNQKYNSTDKFSGVPTSTVFQVGADNSTGSSSYNYIAYCWHSVEGYSKFGSYTGNGDGTPDGPFVYCGFRPAWVMIKEITTTTDYSSWAIFDNARDPSNPTNYLHSIFANRSHEEGLRGNGVDANISIAVILDILSNGFKLRDVGGTEINQYDKEYIFMAFAEQPFNYANAR